MVHIMVARYRLTTDSPAYPCIDEVTSVYVDREILIDGYTDVTDHELGEGEIGYLEIKVYNNGDGDAYDMVATLSMESSDESYCGIYSGNDEDTDSYIAADDDSSTLDFVVRVDSYPSDGDLDLILTVVYEDEYGNSYTDILSNGDLDIDIIPE